MQLAQPLRLWNSYRRYVEKMMQPPVFNLRTEPDYIANRLFTQAILYGLPAAIFALIPSVYNALNQGKFFLACFGVASVLAVACTSLSPGLTLGFRKLSVATALILTAMVLMFFLGAFGIGCAYLITCSVFYALHFNGRLVIRAMLVNVAVCTFFGLLIGLKLLNTNAWAATSLTQWVAHSVNFLFLNLVIVVMIRQSISRLQMELKEKQFLNEQLRESESLYRTLFTSSPSAKLIFDRSTLNFLEVNQAAEALYGYSMAEFGQMNLVDIHSAEAVPGLLQAIADDNQTDGMLSVLKSQHIKKDGTGIEVELMRCNIELRGKPARMIVINDITQHLAQVKAIHQQNDKLKEIAYIQSHLVRLPLTKIMGLTTLIIDEFADVTEPPLLTALSQSADELDQLIRRVVKESETILNEEQSRSFY